MPLGKVLYRPGSASRHVYFPNDGMVSLLAVVAERASGLEVGLVGSEGMVGIPLALGISTSPVKALVQGAGSAMRTSAARLGSELKHNRPLQRALDRCAYVAMATAMQVAVQRRKLIRYSRGTMRILDRKRLRAASCSCYEVIRKLESQA